MKFSYRRLLLAMLCNYCLLNQAYSQSFAEVSEFPNDQGNSSFARTLASEGEITVIGCESCGLSGEVFVYSNCDGNLSQIATLTISNGVPSGALFGRSVDIYDNVIAVGDRFGSVYIYERPMSGWSDMTESAKLTSNSTANRTGELVKISKNYVLAMNDLNGTTKSLSIFEKTGSSWTSMSETARILRPSISGQLSGQFARGFDAYGDTILVASANTDYPGYLYFKPANGWSSNSPITIPDVILEDQTSVNPSNIARAAALTRDHAYISIQSEPLRVYQRPPTGWSSISSKSDDYQLSSSSSTSSLYGFSLDVVSDSVVAVGDPSSDNGYVNVYYKGANGSWSSKTEDQKIVASNGVLDDRFGIALSFNEAQDLIVGADRTDRNAQTDAGSFYLFANTSIPQPPISIEDLPSLLTITADNDLIAFNPEGQISVLETISQLNFSPRGDIFEASNKLLYGISSTGGATDDGFIYRVYPDGRNFEIIHEFDGTSMGQTGSSPSETLVEINGKLIGGTFGDNGTNPLSQGSIFSINLDGSGFSTIYTVTAGSGIRTLHSASNGLIYSAINGSSSQIFRINPDGTGFFSIVDQSVAGTGIRNFVEQLSEFNGKLYGLSNGGGTNGDGYLFSIDLNTDAFSILYSLDGTSDGRLTSTGLVLNNGKLYGSTLLEGGSNDGTIFSYDIIGDSFSVLYNYTASAFDKSGFTIASDGFAYGFMKTGGQNNVGQLLKIDLINACDEVQELTSFESSVSSGPVSKPIEIQNIVPDVLNPIADQTLLEDQSGITIDLTNVFGAVDEPLSNLDVFISQNTNAALFSSFSISDATDLSSAVLNITPAQDEYGSSEVTISVRDARGGLNSTTFMITVTPIPDEPSVSSANTTYGIVNSTGLVISANPSDGNEVTHFQITNIESGTLMFSNETVINEGDFVTVSQGAAGLKWFPAAASDGSFDVQASVSSDMSGLGGSLASAEIFVAKASLTVTSTDQTRNYGAINPVFPFQIVGFVNNEDESDLAMLPTLTTLASSSSDVGEYEISIPELTDENYDFIYQSGTLTITTIPLTVSANDQSIIFGQEIPTLQGEVDGLVNDDDITAIFSTTATSNSGAGTYTIEVSLSDPDTRLGNYTVVKNTGTLTINKSDQVLVFPSIPDVDLANGNAIQLSASSDAGLNVTYTVVEGDGTVDENGTLSINAVGSFNVIASQSGNDNYNAASSISRSFEVVDTRKSNQTISFSQDLSGKKYGDSNIKLEATSTSGLSVSYAVTGPIQLNNDNTVTILGAGEAMITASQSGDASFLSANEVTQTFVISKAILTASADAASTVFGQAIPALSVTYSGFVNQDSSALLNNPPTATTIAEAGSDAGTYVIEVAGGDDDNYNFEYVSDTLTILKAEQVITFTLPDTLDVNVQNQYVLNGSSTSGLKITYALTLGEGLISEDTLTITSAGLGSVVASQEGNKNYNSAASVVRDFVAINTGKTDQTITFDTISDQKYGDQVEISGIASSGLDVTYRLVEGQGSINGSELTIEGVGKYTVEASQIGNEHFNPATPVLETFSVTKATLTFTADDLMILQGAEIPELTYTITGFRLSDDISQLDTVPSLTTEANNQSPVGAYQIRWLNGSDDRYAFDLIEGILTIEAPLGFETADVSLYPNPASRQVVIDLQHQSKDGIIQLIDLQGKVIKEQPANQPQVDLQLKDVSAGTYLIRYQSAEGYYLRKLIVK